VPSVRVNSCRWLRSQRAKASSIAVASCSNVAEREAIKTRPGRGHLAEIVGEPAAGNLPGGPGFIRELMRAVGPAANGMITRSRPWPGAGVGRAAAGEERDVGHAEDHVGNLHSGATYEHVRYGQIRHNHVPARGIAGPFGKRN